MFSWTPRYIPRSPQSRDIQLMLPLVSIGRLKLLAPCYNRSLAMLHVASSRGRGFVCWVFSHTWSAETISCECHVLEKRATNIIVQAQSQLLTWQPGRSSYRRQQHRSLSASGSKHHQMETRPPHDTSSSWQRGMKSKIQGFAYVSVMFVSRF